MNKINMTDLAGRLVEKHGLDQREANYFVEAIIATLHKGLETDKLVKIKGLGTFKIIGVEARESVNIHTGERVTIDSHSKLSFTPDAAMKELVNKPFSQFETIVLKDGVEFDDMPQQDDAPESEAIADTEIAKSQEPIVEQTPAVEEKPSVVDEPIVVDEPTVEVEPTEETEPVVKPELAEKTEPEHLASEPINTTEPTVEKQPFPWLWVLAAAIGGFILGFIFDRLITNSDGTEQDIPIAVSAEDSLDAPEQQPADTMTLQPETVSEDVALEAESNPAEEAEADPEPEELPAAAPAFDSQKYEDMDPRVRHGAYRIIGVQDTVKAYAGETVRHLSRHYLGPDMECYVEVLNGLKASDQLKGGQKVLIPKLEWKRSSRKK